MTKSTSSEDWLPFLLYGLHMFLDPKPFMMMQEFEPFDRRTLRSELYSLRRARLLERQGRGRNQTWRLTAHGRLTAAGGVDAPARWQRPWDGKWRMVVFDLPLNAHSQRIKLWRWLRTQQLGLLQRSVWISPDPLDETTLPMVRAKAPTSSITLVEGQPVHPNRDADLVMAAWDFEAINRNYGEVLERAEQGMELASLPDLPPAAFRHWLAAERTTWALAVAEDPFLPEVLLPEGYLGKEAWTRRQAVHAAIGKRQRVS